MRDLAEKSLFALLGVFATGSLLTYFTPTGWGWPVALVFVIVLILFLRFFRGIRHEGANSQSRFRLTRSHLLFAAVGVLLGGIAWYLLSSIMEPEPSWSPEDRHRGLHCLTGEAEAYDSSRLSVNEASVMVAKHYARDKEVFALHGYQMCQADEQGWHPTWIWFRDSNENAGISYRVTVVPVKSDGCVARTMPVKVINNVPPERLPPNPTWVMKIENCSASGYAGPAQ
ncbi:MAG: hypothetical protein OXU75_20980 [Deltaproteobacteria bacterium]|nr:hypothetical protein [Deltaproteobacteria bacterium]